MAFNFGNPSASKSLFGGGTPNASGSSAATPGAQGFNFDTGTPAQSGGGGFSFGATKPTSTLATGASSGFSFGTPASTTTATTPASASGILFSTPAQAQSNTGTALKTAGFGFALGGSTPAKPAAPAGQGLTLGLGLATGSTASTASAGLSFGGIGATKPLNTTGASTLGVTPLAAKPAVSLGAGQAAKSGGLSLGGLGSSTPAAKTGGLTLGGAGASGVLGGGAKTSAALGLTLSLGKTTGLSTATAPTTTAPVAATLPLGPTMNYRELEEAINKWTVELEEQEKVFLQQATQVNGWDRLLVENGEKITTLHNDVEKVKTDQQRLEHELDYIVAQQRELEDMLAPLEETIKTKQGSIFTHHADVEREHTYQLAETIDSQLKRMVQDLKEVIEHLNTSNTAGEANDPIHQIARILNAHMDSLQWIDHNTAMCQRKVDEISRQNEIVRRDQERNVQLAFD